MFKSPYDTRACKNHLMKDLYNDVKIALLQDDLMVSPVGVRKDVLVVDERLTQLRPFAHPLIIQDTSGHNIVVYDARGISRLDKVSGQLKVTKELIFADLIATLMQVTWLDTDGKDLLNLGEVTIKVFAKLFAENLGRRSKLDHATTQYIEIVSAYYYCCLHHNEDTFDDTDKMRLIKRVSRAVGLQEPTVHSILNDIPYIGTIERLSQIMVTSGRSVILEKVSPGFIYTLLGGIWFGPNAKEVAAVAMEHPPTFTAMLYMVAIDRSYRKTILSGILDLVDSRKERRGLFIQAVGRVKTFS